MQVSKILKSPERVAQYYAFILSFDMYTLRWIGGVGAIYSAAFVIIDFYRSENFAVVALLRGFTILLFCTAYAFSVRRRSLPDTFHRVCYLLSSCLFAVAFLLDYFSGMPQFFLPNYLCLFLFVFNTALGHSLQFKGIQAASVSAIFIVFSIFLSPHSASHVAQIWNVLITATLSILVGFLIERYRLLNFVARLKLLESRKRVTNLNSLKTKLLSIVSHDLASPVNNLRGLLALNQSNALDPEEMKVHTARVDQSLENVSTTMTELLRWSSSQMAGFKPKIEQIQLSSLIGEVIRLSQFSAQRKELTIQMHISHPVVNSDGELLKIVLRNFLSNAIKFSPNKSTIIISASANQQETSISVRDNGIGMSEEQIRNLFSTRVTPSAGTANERGSGVGLIICRDFIGKIGGSLKVTSKENQGSEFTLCIQNIV